MNRVQVSLILAGATLIGLGLVFPRWKAGEWSLGRAWIGAPPSAPRAEDFEFSLGPDWSEEDHQRVREHFVASFGAPEIDWTSQRIDFGLILATFGAMVFAHRGRPRAGREHPDAGVPYGRGAGAGSALTPRFSGRGDRPGPR